MGRRNTRRGTAGTKEFLDAIDEGDVIKIHECLTVHQQQRTEQNQAGRSLVEGLSRSKLVDLWKVVTASIETLAPPARRVSFMLTPPRVNEVRNMATSTPLHRRTIANLLPASPIVAAGALGKTNLPENRETRSAIVTSLLKLVFPAFATKQEPPNIGYLAPILGSIFAIGDHKEELLLLAEHMWRNKWTGRAHLAEQALRVILIDLHQKKPTKADIRRLSAFREAISNFSTWLVNLWPDLLKCVSHQSLLVEPQGQNFIAQLFCLREDLLLQCHEEAKNFLLLPTTKKIHAKALGKIYGLACLNAPETLVEHLQFHCLQFYMYRFIRTPWDIDSQTMMPLGHLLQVLLFEVHKVAKAHPAVMAIVTEAYEPILWRHLVNANNCFRCNASRLLLDLYPLERPGVLREENEKFLNEQYKYILSMLEDDCHLIRLLATREVCQILATHWEILPHFFRNRTVQSYIMELPFESGVPELRREALDGLTIMVTEGPYALLSFMGPHLPKLRPLLFDPNKIVCRAMIQFLLALQKVAHPNSALDRVPFYWDIVPPKSVVQLLGAENSSSPIVKNIIELLFVSLHPTDPEKLKKCSVVKRVCWLVKTNLNAARNFYKNSSHVMDMQSAARFMVQSLFVLYKFYKRQKKGRQELDRKRRRSTENKENAQDDQASGSEDGTSSETTLTVSDVSTSDNSTEDLSLMDPAIVSGLLDVIIVLWILHIVELRKPESQRYMEKLIIMAKDTLHVLFKAWRDNQQVMHPLMLLASMLPNKRVRQLLSYSTSQLRSLGKQDIDEGSENLANLLLTALCNWQSGELVLEMTGDSLEHAINSALPKTARSKEPKASRQVAFDRVDRISPVCALQYLRWLLVNTVNHEYIVQEEAKALHELLVRIEPIRNLVVTRLEKEQPLSQISDDLLHQIFLRYVTLICFIRIPDFDRANKFFELITWTVTHLLPHTNKQQQDYSNDQQVPLVAQLIQDVCTGVGLALHLDLVPSSRVMRFMNFGHALLDSSDMTQSLVTGVLRLVGGLSHHAHCVDKEQREGPLPEDFIQTALPNLVIKVLISCVDSDKIDATLGNEKELRELESNVEEFLAMLCECIGKNSIQAKEVCVAFLRTILKLTENCDFPDLPLCANFFLVVFLSSNIETNLIVGELLKLIYDDFGEDETGRESVEVLIQSLEMPKWRGILSKSQLTKLRQAYEACTAAALQRTLDLQVDTTPSEDQLMEESKPTLEESPEVVKNSSTTPALLEVPKQEAIEPETMDVDLE